MPDSLFAGGPGIDRSAAVCPEGILDLSFLVPACHSDRRWASSDLGLGAGTPWDGHLSYREFIQPTELRFVFTASVAIRHWEY